MVDGRVGGGQVNANTEGLAKMDTVIEEHKNRIGQIETRTEKILIDMAKILPFVEETYMTKTNATQRFNLVRLLPSRRAAGLAGPMDPPLVAMQMRFRWCLGR